MPLNLFGEFIEIEIEKGATFSECGAYRYKLWRTWDNTRGSVAFIGLNPSTADATNDDPTIRKCVKFGRNWGFGGIIMVNLFAFRATDPADMMKANEPVGPGNDEVLRAVKSSMVIAAWGTKGGHLGRDRQVMRMFDGLQCLKVTQEGHPQHPLYIRDDTVPFKWANDAGR